MTRFEYLNISLKFLFVHNFDWLDLAFEILFNASKKSMEGILFSDFGFGKIVSAESIKIQIILEAELLSAYSLEINSNLL